MSQYMFGCDNKPEARCGQQCYVPVEDIWERVERQLCKPNKKCCPPKTKARDAIRIAQNESGRCFQYGRKLCDGTQEQSVINRYYKMDIREKGFCDVLMCVPPERATMDGAICWAWPKEFHRLPPGYYEADVYIDGCICHTHLFYIPKCNVMAVPTEVEYKNECTSCGHCGHSDHTVCGCNVDLCCSAIPMVDDEIQAKEEIECEKGCDQC